MEKTPQPSALPVLPLAGPTTLVNVVYAGFTLNGSFMLQLAEQRNVPLTDLDAPQREAVYEVGRYTLTPRTVRQLHDLLTAAIATYEEHTGVPLPSLDGFAARAALKTLKPPKP